jgi:hypothetical protein
MSILEHEANLIISINIRKALAMKSTPIRVSSTTSNYVPLRAREIPHFIGISCFFTRILQFFIHWCTWARAL